MLEANKLMYRKAYTELNELLKYLPKEQVKKIPRSIRQGIKSQMDVHHVFVVDPYKTLDEQDMLDETKALLVEIFERYLCEEEDRDRWKIYDKFCFDRIEELKREKYNPEDVFVNRNNEKEEEEQEDSVEEIETKALTEVERIGLLRG